MIKSNNQNTGNKNSFKVKGKKHQKNLEGNYSKIITPDFAQNVLVNKVTNVNYEVAHC